MANTNGESRPPPAQVSEVQRIREEHTTPYAPFPIGLMGVYLTMALHAPQSRQVAHPTRTLGATVKWPDVTSECQRGHTPALSNGGALGSAPRERRSPARLQGHAPEVNLEERSPKHKLVLSHLSRCLSARRIARRRRVHCGRNGHAGVRSRSRPCALKRA